MRGILIPNWTTAIIIIIIDTHSMELTERIQLTILFGITETKSDRCFFRKCTNLLFKWSDLILTVREIFLLI